MQGDESPLQIFFAAHPYLLTCLLPPGRDTWCWDRPRLGGELIPDFLLCTHNSTGYQWVMVELESPAVRPMTQAGLPASKLNQALSQVRTGGPGCVAISHTLITNLALTANRRILGYHRDWSPQRPRSRTCDEMAGIFRRTNASNDL